METKKIVKKKTTVDLIARSAMASRLAMQEGMPRYHLEATNQLPYLVFSATFGKGGFDNPKASTGLLLLNIACPGTYVVGVH